MRFAFLGRTSDEDAQDPSLSIPRQLVSCEAVVKPLGDTIVAHYWDVESGRKFLDVRGNGADASRFNIAVAPRRRNQRPDSRRDDGTIRRRDRGEHRPRFPNDRRLDPRRAGA